MHTSDIFSGEFNPVFLFVIKYDRTRSGYPHCHDYIELLYILDGVGAYEIDNERYTVGRGDLLLINPQTSHANIVTDKEHPLVILAAGFTQIHLKNQPVNEIHLTDTPILHIESTLSQKIEHLFFSMLAEKESNLPGKYDMMQCYLSEMLLHIIRAYTDLPKSAAISMPSRQKHHIVQTILDYMEEHYAEKISLDGIASDMYLSPIYISRLFKEVTGHAPIHHLIHIRLQKSIELMKTHPEVSIRQISQAVGYEDAGHYSKLFKKHTGCSPLAYRQNLNQ